MELNATVVRESVAESIARPHIAVIHQIIASSGTVVFVSHIIGHRGEIQTDTRETNVAALSGGDHVLAVHISAGSHEGRPVACYFLEGVVCGHKLNVRGDELRPSPGRAVESFHNPVRRARNGHVMIIFPSFLANSRPCGIIVPERPPGGVLSLFCPDSARTAAFLEFRVEGRGVRDGVIADQRRRLEVVAVHSH